MSSFFWQKLVWHLLPSLELLHGRTTWSLKMTARKQQNLWSSCAQRSEWQWSGGSEPSVQDLEMAGRMKSTWHFSDFCQLMAKPKCQGCVAQNLCPLFRLHSFFRTLQRPRLVSLHGRIQKGKYVAFPRLWGISDSVVSECGWQQWFTVTGAVTSQSVIANKTSTISLQGLYQW